MPEGGQIYRSGGGVQPVVVNKFKRGGDTGGGGSGIAGLITGLADRKRKQELEEFGNRLAAISFGLVDENTAFDDQRGQELFRKFTGQNVPAPTTREVTTQMQIPPAPSPDFPIDRLAGQIQELNPDLSPPQTTFEPGNRPLASEAYSIPTTSISEATGTPPLTYDEMAKPEPRMREMTKTIPGLRFQPRTIDQLARYVRGELFQGREVPDELLAASKVDPGAQKLTRDLIKQQDAQAAKAKLSEKTQAEITKRRQMADDAKMDRELLRIDDRNDRLDKRIAADRNIKQMGIDASNTQFQARREAGKHKLFIDTMTKLEGRIGLPLAYQVADGMINQGLSLEQLPVAEAVKQASKAELESKLALRNARTADLSQTQVYRAKGYELNEAKYLTLIDKLNAELQIRAGGNAQAKQELAFIGKQLSALALAEKTGSMAARDTVNNAVKEILAEKLNIEEGTPEGLEKLKWGLGQFFNGMGGNFDWGKKPLTLSEKGKGPLGTITPPISNPVIAPKLGQELKSKLPGKAAPVTKVPTAEDYFQDLERRRGGRR